MGLELPHRDRPYHLLDIGCGSTISGETVTKAGHILTGYDISQAMLDIALERETGIDLCKGDIGNGLPFRMNSFDGALSISVLQWLCKPDKAHNNSFKRLKRFLETLFQCL